MSRSYHAHWQPIAIKEQLWRAKYHQFKKLVIEIGAGQGLHAIQYAETHPDTFYIAIERTQNKFGKMQSRLAHHPHITNLMLINEDATKWLAENIQAEEVDAYFILYPNPYPKQKQANKRWHYMPFMDFLFNTLQQSAPLTLATNIQSYFDEACEVFAIHSSVELQSSGKIDQNFKGRTHFERKYLERGETCYQLKVKKK